MPKLGACHLDGAPVQTPPRSTRDILHRWFRNDLMGLPGDEDGGGMSAFVVFSSMGFYPVAPGTASDNIGSPVFRRVTVDLDGGKKFVVDSDRANSKTAASRNCGWATARTNVGNCARGCSSLRRIGLTAHQWNQRSSVVITSAFPFTSS